LEVDIVGEYQCAESPEGLPRKEVGLATLDTYQRPGIEIPSFSSTYIFEILE